MDRPLAADRSRGSIGAAHTAAIVAADLAWDNALDVRRTRMLLLRDQAVQVALGAESWVASILAQDLAESDTDHLGEIWATELPAKAGRKLFSTSQASFDDEV